MNKRIPIATAKEVAKKHELDQVILVAYERDLKARKHMTHVVTYGKTKVDCLQAAQGGNMVKKALGWPDSLQAEPVRAKDMKLVKKDVLLSIINWTESRDGSPESDEKALKAINEIVTAIFRGTA